MEDLHFRLRALRRQNQLSLEQLGQRTGLTKSYLSKLERAVSAPSISTILKLAQAYGLGVAQLIGSNDEDHDESISVVRRDEREPLVRHGDKLGYRYQAMAGKRHVKVMDPFIVYPPRAHEARDAAFPHSGEEFMLVLKGSVHIRIGEKSFQLDEGDSVYFDSELPHSICTVGEVDAEVLVVATNSASAALRPT
jgi:transcriptional regulator with XRE-family HTH domain